MSKAKSRPCKHPKTAVIPASDLDAAQCKKCGRFLPDSDNWEDDNVRIIDLTGGSDGARENSEI